MTVRRYPGVAVAVALALGALGCDGSDGDDASKAKPPPPAKPADFPAVKGRSIAQLKREAGGEGPILSPSVSVLEPGRNRFGFGLFHPSRAQISDAPVALYVAPAGGGRVKGPIIARWESLAVKAQYRSRGVESDRDAAKSLYTAQLDLPRGGRYEVLAIARLDDRLVAASNAGGALMVSRSNRIPDVGERPPRTDTPTKADAGGDISKIDTRQPPSSMHDVSFADVLGKQPAVLLFATPALCQSRVCGPVVDIAEEVKAERGDGVAFIHQEIFRDNEIDKGYRPEVLEWRLPTEPWLFTVDREGRVAARLEGAFSARELAKAIDAARRGARG